MERWALISGLRGDLEVYEQIQRDLKKTSGVKSLFVLGDLIGPERNCDVLLNRLQNPQRGDLKPACIYGWWEEQLLAERGFRGDRKADDLRDSQGEDAVAALLNTVDPSHMNWLASLQFGFIELDCALIHGSSSNVGDNLTPKTSPLILLDRLTRLSVNRLFTARSTQQFHLELTGGGIDSQVKDLSGKRQYQQTVPKRKVIGIGAGLNYTIYDVGSDKTHFLTASNQTKTTGLGFA
ncbi:phosphoesterase [Prochlorococcus sp. MIT 1300]|uniref:phosphoesterase n=1 Tax=Prochlorococcus sp. MIT 1300 TaxID=3096218 RepID=UPI002A755EB0|nr:phosphoesterase [Prochlorococcus sp. MIT 1300]